MKKLILLFCTFFVSITLFSQEKTERLTPEKLWELGRVSLYDVSPDGKKILYGVTYYDIEENKGNRDIYSIRVDGGDRGSATQLTDLAGNESEAQYRPDGKKIGFLLKGFLWEMNPDGSEAKQISEEQMNGFKYSPDGKNILFIRDVKYDQTPQEIYPDLPKATARISDDLMYRHWNDWHDYAYSNVFYASYENGKVGVARNIMGEAYDSPVNPFGGMEQINWSHNGKYIAYTCKKISGKEYAESTNSDIYLYEIATGKTKNLTEGMNGYDMEPVFSADDRYLAWNSMKTPGFESDRNRIFIYDFVADKKWEMTEGLNQSCNHPHWNKDGSAIYFTSGDKATYQIYMVDFNKGGRMRKITSGHYNYYDFILTDDNIIARRASMSQPHEIYRLPLDTGRPNQVTFTNKEKLANVEMGQVTKRWVETTDGKKMMVWMILPPGFDENKKYPALLYCQGGPQSAVSQFWSYRWNFQMMAANDYVIVAPNRRGLPSFGRKWNDEISGDWGGQPMQDLLSAIDNAKAEPYIDETKLGAVGASFGGYSVYWLAGNHEQRFKTFISHAGLFNLESWYGTTEEMFFANQDIGGAYWEQTPPKSYATDSPHNYVKNWDTPMLVIHGEKDFRVPIGEGMQAFQAAQLKGIPSRFLYFPDEGHWVQSPQNGILWQRVFFDWLGRSLKTQP